MADDDDKIHAENCLTGIPKDWPQPWATDYDETEDIEPENPLIPWSGE